MKCSLVKKRKEDEYIILGHDNEFEICFYHNYRCSELYLLCLYKTPESIIGRYHKSISLVGISEVHPELGALLIKNIDIVHTGSSDVYIKVGDFFEHIYPHLNVFETIISI